MSDKLEISHKTFRKKLETTLDTINKAVQDTLVEIETIRQEVEKIEFEPAHKEKYEARMLQFLQLREHLSEIRNRRNGIEETLAKMTLQKLQDITTIDVAHLLGLVAKDFEVE
ncbi:MAG: hypothetical protein ACRC2T_18360 [Thermoguttaceae bacterium]